MTNRTVFSSCRHIQVLGHRGVPLEHQENSLAGVQRAAELGLDGVELDVRFTRDHRPVIFHDRDSLRLCGTPGRIADQTWAQLRNLEITRELQIGPRTLSYPRTARIPLLEQALEEVGSRMLVNIELKTEENLFRSYQLGAAVAKLVAQMKLQEQVFVTSFHPWALAGLKAGCLGINCGLVSLSYPDSLASTLTQQALKTEIVSVAIQALNGDQIEHLKQRGHAVGVWTLFPIAAEPQSQENASQGEGRLRMLMESGLDFLITDDPLKAHQLLENN